ncbi:MAG TPA: hypothetical protein VKG25_16455 [Bryobacteraceae bacterium]|nr:hypothetical protein [Bryobacteraceae bacterium]
MSEGLVTLFVAAEAREFAGFMQMVEKSERLSWPVQFARRVEYRGSVAVLAANGPGSQLAAQAVCVAAERERVASVVSTGFCGGLDPALAPSDIFVARELIGLGPVVPPACPNASIGALISSDRVAVTAAEKAELRTAGGDAVEMEAAGVARAAGRLSLPFYCVRVVTDTAGENLPLDFNRMRDAQGRFSRFQIVAAGLRNPGVVFPKLMKLNRRCKSASKALGVFLANCRF